MNVIKKLIITCFFVFPTMLEAQQVVTGHISDATNGEPIPYASIYIANTTIGTSSDEFGNYRLTLPGGGSYEIVVSYLGYQSAFYKINEPKPLHHISFILDIEEKGLQEVEVTARSRHRQKDKDLFWNILLGAKPSKNGLELLNPEKVFFFLNNDNVLHVSCKEPIEIINHELGYHILYLLQSFQYDYKTDEVVFYGKPFFEELIPPNDQKKRDWDKKRQNVYAVSITHFIRALYQDQLHEEGFLLTKSDSLQQRNINFPLNEILQVYRNHIEINIDSPLFLACFSKPVNDRMIQNSYDLMFSTGNILNRKTNTSFISVKVGNNETFPVIKLMPQQITIFADGTYTGEIQLQEYRNRISGLSSQLPIEYNYNNPINDPITDTLNDNTGLIQLNEVTVRGKRIRKGDEARSENWAAKGSDKTIYREEFENRFFPNISSLLIQLGGLRVVSTNNGSFPVFRSYDKPPSVYVDGVLKISTNDPEWNDKMQSLITVHEIECIDIFRNANSALFGFAGANGVISITTRRGTFSN